MKITKSNDYDRGYLAGVKAAAEKAQEMADSWTGMPQAAGWTIADALDEMELPDEEARS